DASDQVVRWSSGKPLRPLFRWSGAQPLRQTGARFSPDRQWAVFSGAPMDFSGSSIWIAPVREQGTVSENDLIRLTDSRGIEIDPYWSPDGRTIYFLSDSDRFLCIWGRHVDPISAQPKGPVFSVAHFHRARQTLQNPSPYAGDIGLSAAKNSLVF